MDTEDKKVSSMEKVKNIPLKIKIKAKKPKKKSTVARQ